MLRHIAKVEKVYAVGCLFTIAASILAQVFLRYVFARPLTWVLELSTYLFIWSVFIGASYAYKQIRHITIITYKKLTTRIRIALDVLVNAAVVCTMFAFILQAAKVMPVEAQTTTSSLPVDLPRFLFYSLPMSVGAGLIIVTGVYFVLVALFAPGNDGRRLPVETGNADSGAVY